MIRRPPRSTLSSSSAASDVYKRQLLKPIRDLSENWSIDIAQELESYLHELGDIQISFGAGESLNFAEAALLIQGSACIYGKKVEYLHALVFKVMEMLAARNAEENNGDESEQPALTDGDDASSDGLEEIEIRVGKELELELDPSRDPLLSAVGLLPMPPTELLALEHDEEFASRQNGQETYHLLHNCSVHSTGAILLDEGIRDMLDDDLLLTGVGQSTEQHVLPSAVLDMDNDLEEISSDEEEGGEMGFDEPDDEPEACSANGPCMFPDTPATGTPMSGAMHTDGVDPWMMLDPHDSSQNSDHKPFFRATAPHVPRVAAFGRDLSETSPLDLPVCPQSIRSACFADLAQVYQQELNRRKFVHRRWAQQRHQHSTEVDSDDDEDDHLDEDQDEPGLSADWMDDDVNDDDDGSSAPDDETNESYGLGSLVGISQDARAHIESFFQSSKAYASETELSRRVGAWQDKMGPKLYEQNQRPGFDMQSYGNRILATLPECADDGEQGDFSVLTQSCEAWDVCRIFLASLQLAADRNIDIGCSAPEGEVCTDFKIKVLSLSARRPSVFMDQEEVQPVMPSHSKSAAKMKGLRFAEASPVICDTYGADEYDRSYQENLEITSSPDPKSHKRTRRSAALALQEATNSTTTGL
eukprot:TRINITY_DN9748_c0_g1_i2.p1 TRINITY_DN9748_c0_g1~~TRINITY_DN9748_c0_g1_i2.p1  ORF type:complete len:644 (+),score=133.08 TRINITY_DN9748_c0_g1_i2:122-2053(+)